VAGAKGSYATDDAGVTWRTMFHDGELLLNALCVSDGVSYGITRQSEILAFTDIDHPTSVARIPGNPEVIRYLSVRLPGIACASDTLLYVSTTGGSSWHSFRVPSPNRVQCLLLRDSLLYVGTNEYVRRFNISTLEEQPISTQGIKLQSLQSVSLVDGSFYIATFGEIYRYDETSQRWSSVLFGINAQKFMGLYRYGQNRLLISYGRLWLNEPTSVERDPSPRSSLLSCHAAEIYPNPARPGEGITIGNPDPSARVRRVIVSSVTGVVLRSIDVPSSYEDGIRGAGNTRQFLPLGALPAGVYYVNVLFDTRSEQRLLIVQ
jgi:hypothetical protein